MMKGLIADRIINPRSQDSIFICPEKKVALDLPTPYQLKLRSLLIISLKWWGKLIFRDNQIFEKQSSEDSNNY